MLIKQLNQENVSFVIIGISLNKNFSYGPFTFDGCYDMVQMSIDFKNIGIVHAKKTAYRVYYKDISKNEAKKLMNKFNLVLKTSDIYCND